MAAVDEDRNVKSAVVRSSQKELIRRARSTFLVWASLTTATLVYVFVGSVSTHSWRWNVLRQRADERVRTESLVSVWQRQWDNLPSLNSGVLTTTLFGSALALFAVGVIAGLWLTLSVAEPKGVKDHKSRSIGDVGAFAPKRLRPRGSSANDDDPRATV